MKTLFTHLSIFLFFTTFSYCLTPAHLEAEFHKTFAKESSNDLAEAGRPSSSPLKKYYALGYPENNKKEKDKAYSRLQTAVLGTGVIAVTPTTIYDNDVAGGAQGINRTITVKNNGPGILSVTAINITGANSSEFVLSGLPSFPQTINSGSSISFSIAFNPSSIGIKTASVNISSDDASNAVTPVPIRGLGTAGLGGNNEPSLQLLLNLLEIPVNVGDDDISTTIINSNPALQKAALLGDEIKSPKFEKAGNGNVTITPLAVFGPTSNATVLGMGWYKSGNATTQTELFTVLNNPLSNGQTVNPNIIGTLSFDPAANVFGFYTRWPFFTDRHLYSEDNLNTFPGSIPHHVRVFPYKKNGAAVANTYLIAFEENTSGFDYQDLIFIVQNVKPSSSNTLLFVENADKFPSNDNVVFSRVQTPWSRDGVTFNTNHDSVRVRLNNKGLNPLIISNLTLSNNAGWKIEKFNGAAYVPGSGLPFTVNSGSFVDLIVRFIALDQAARVKVLHDSLFVSSNDDTNPLKTIFLNGLWQKSGEGINEPYAQEIINTFGFKTGTGFGHTDPDVGDSTKLKGSEIKPSYFLRADPALPVSVRQMSAYHGCCTVQPETLVWLSKGSATPHSVFTHDAKDAQTVLPRKNASGGPAAGTFNPTTAFGFKIGSKDYTDASKNPLNKIGIRVWKAFDTKGNIIPNSYIMSNDYLGTAATNYDYNDNMYFISNVKPEIGTAYFSNLNVAPSDLDFGEKVLATTNTLQLNLNSLGQTYSNGSKDPLLKIDSVVIIGENKSEFSANMPAKTTLNPQEATTLTVTFKPVSQGLKIADLRIYYNNALGPKRVPLYGIAKAQGTTVTANFRINSGASNPVTINGKTWSADQFAFDNLEPYTNPTVTQISATDEDALYLDEQSSNADKKPFRYELTVPNGDYVVRLHFAEIYWGSPASSTSLAGGAGSRVMSVKLENQLRLVNYDLTQDVGGASAVIKNFPVTVTDGKLNIDFSATVNRPMLSALEVYSFTNSTLGVNFLDFKGKLVNNDVQLEWTTTDEVNTKYFEVQKQTGNGDFKPIGQVASANIPLQVNNYAFVDKNPGASNNYYRIKEVDVDGKATYSKIIRIDISDLFAVQLFPNPANDKVYIQYSGLSGNQKANLTIYNLSGSELKSKTVMLSGGKIEVDISSLSAGMYIINLSSDDFLIRRKFLKSNK